MHACTQEEKIEVALFGDAGVGKMALLLRFAQDFYVSP